MSQPELLNSPPIAPHGETETGRATVSAVSQPTRNLAAAVLVIYLIAFALPVCRDTGVLANHLGVQPGGSVYGWQAFLFGWFAQRFGGWFANVAVWIGAFLLATGRTFRAGIAGAAALLLGVTYLVPLFERRMFYPESYAAGYYCWLASAALLVGLSLGRKLLGPGWRSIGFGVATVAVAVVGVVSLERRIVAATAPPTDAALVDRLKSDDVKLRRSAALTLGLHHHAEYVPALIEALHDPDEKVRQNAVNALGAMGPAAEPAVPALIDLLRNPARAEKGTNAPSKLVGNSRSAAAAALGRIGPRANEAVPTLIAALEDENLPVRRWSATSLGEIGAEARSAVPALVKALGQSDVQVRRDAIASLGKIGVGTGEIAALRAAASDPDSEVRNAATILLSGLHKGSAKAP